MDADSKAAINYINFSALAYAQFDDDARSHDIGYILKNKLYTETKDFKADKSEIAALKEESNPLRSWILLDFISTSSGFRGAVFQVPGKKIILGKLFYAYVYYKIKSIKTIVVE